LIIVVQIIRIRAQTESIPINDESLGVLAAIGVKSTLRCALPYLYSLTWFTFNSATLVFLSHDIRYSAAIPGSPKYLWSFFSRIFTVHSYYVTSECPSTDLLPVCLSLRFNGHFPGEPGLAGVY